MKVTQGGLAVPYPAVINQRSRENAPVIELSSISTVLAGLYVGMAAFALFLDRVKGFVLLRWFALIAVIAAAYMVVTSASLSASVPAATVNWLRRWATVLLALHSVAWVLVGRFDIRGSRNATQVLLLVTCTLFGITALLPNWVGRSKLRGDELVRNVLAPSAPAVTAWGYVVLSVVLLTLLYAFVALRKTDWPGSRSPVLTIGLVAYYLGVSHEAAFLAGIASTPLVLSLGSMALVIASAVVFGQDVLSNFAKLRELSERLENDVNARNQELLQAQEALTRADRLAALGQLAAGVGHEINNPLTYVMTNLRELVEQLPTAERDSDRIHLAGLASEALDGTERIRRVVGDLRLLTRSRDTEQLESLDVHHVLGDALKLAEHVLKHRARVHEDYADVPRVKAEPQRLAQVFVNLLVNAAQAIPDTTDRGIITVRTRRSNTGRTVIEIIDNGQGISPQHLGRIFEPYFTTKTQGEGTGLGLFVSLGIVRSFGGDLEVESELGHGATMRVSLPASEVVESLDLTPSQLNRVVPRRARILVIDDEPVVARAMRRMLQEHDVSIVLDAHHALELLEQGDTFDVLICDLMMPDISGVDLYVQVCDRWPELKNRFLFITGGAVTPKAQELLQQSDVRCLHKPVRPEELQAMIDSIVAALDHGLRFQTPRPLW